MEELSRRPPGASDRFIRFLSPPDVRGVGYLARYRQGKNPDEWLYLPSMKRERRIGTRDRDAAFVGTSFNYEDLDFMEFDDSRYDTSLMAPQTADGPAVYVIQLIPRTPSVYTKKILTMRKDDLSVLTVELFIGTGRAPAKRLTFADYTPVDGYVVAMRVEMADLRKGSRTAVIRHNVVINAPQPSDRYTIQHLLREDSDAVAAAVPPKASALASKAASGLTRSQPEPDPLRLGGGFSGYVEARSFGTSTMALLPFDRLAMGDGVGARNDAVGAREDRWGGATGGELVVGDWSARVRSGGPRRAAVAGVHSRAVDHRSRSALAWT